MKIDIKLFNRYKKERWLVSQKHPTKDLIIWNYSQSTQYEQKWDKHTLMCRGLVTDFEGNVISKGFSKFFNYSEGRTNIPAEVHSITASEKLDGSYIGVFHYDGEWIVNSKGSFDSPQSNWAKEILDNKDVYKYLIKDLTYCFELIHPENRIVVDYGGKKDLVLLAAFNMGKEVGISRYSGIFDIAEYAIYDYFSPEDITKLDVGNQEGFVIKFGNGERCKIKFEEYIRLHSIVTNATSYDIWKTLKLGEGFEEILELVPDEFYDWVKQTKMNIEKDFYKLLSDIYQEYSDKGCDKLRSEKEFAKLAKECTYTHQLYSLRQGKSIHKWAWDKVKPEFKKAFQL